MAGREIIGIAGAVFAFGGAVAMAFGPTAYPAYAVEFFWGGIAIMAIGALAALYALVSRSNEATQVGRPTMGNDTYNNSGNNFGHMGPLNIGNQRLVFSEEIGRDLLRHLTTVKPIDLRTVGSNADQQTGSAFYDFLSRNGFTVSRSMIGMMAPPPDHKISVTDAGDRYIVIVAPNA